MHFLLKHITILKLLPLLFLISSGKLKIKEDIKKTEYASVIFVGDLMCHGPQIESARVLTNSDSFDFYETYNYVSKIISSANLAIGNLETVIGGKEIGYSGYPTFNSPIDFVEGIKNAGFDFLITANNHTYDKGKKGLVNTLYELGKLNIPSTGSYKSQVDRDSIRIISVNNIKIAILAYSYGINGYKLPRDEKYLINIIDTNLIKRDINKAKELKSDLILTYFHYGEEYQKLPNSFQKNMTQFAVKHGSDLVIGSHPHVIQPIEYFKGNNNLDTGFVAYSLGNFISNQRERYTDCGIILKFIIVKEDSTLKLSSVEYIPTWVFKGYKDNKLKYYILPNEENMYSKYNFLTTNDILKSKQALFDTESIITKFSTKTKRVKEIN